MNIKKILKELEKQKDKLTYLKKLLKIIKNNKLIKQIQELINSIEKEQKLEDKLTTAPIQPRQVMQAIQNEIEVTPKYKTTPLSQEEIIIPRTSEELNHDNPYKSGNSESYLTEDVRNPIKKRLTESYEVNHLESTISSEAKEQITSKLKPTMSEQEMVKNMSELEDKTPEYTTGTAQFEEEDIFNPLHPKKKRKEHNYDNIY